MDGKEVMPENDQDEKEVLMKLTEKCLAQSNLIFLVADLRLLSATGRINTNFDALCLDSDCTPRMTSEAMAGFCDTETRRGITPRHVMAIVLLEMHKSWTCLENNEKPKKSRLGTETVGANEDEDEDEGLIRNLQLGHQDRFMARKADGGLHFVLRGYVETLRKDLVKDIPKIPYSTYTRQNLPDMKPELGLLSDDSIRSSPEVVSLEKKKSTMRKRKQLKKDRDDFKNVSKLFFQKATDEYSEDCVNEHELETVVADAINSRDRDKLDFLPSFFVPNSITRTIAETETELVWLNDWHPLKECTYGISVNRTEKTIMLVFRGAITRSDWEHVLRWWTIAVKNPIEADYPNKHHLLKVHRGFYRYLFRLRKDTQTSKYDEIAARIAFYGKRLGNFRLIVTGHSLGAALSTIFSFFASLEERFTINGPIQVVNFGSPKVAAYQFADAIRHQEDIGKIRIARFRNTNDVATHLPGVPLKLSRRGSRYYHVGLEIQLPYARNAFFRACGGQPQPRVRFYDPEPWVWSFVRQWKDIYATHVPVRFWLIPLFHTLIEHQSRLHLADESHVLNNHTLEEFYEMRDKLTANKKRSLLRKKGRSHIERTNDLTG